MASFGKNATKLAEQFAIENDGCRNYDGSKGQVTLL